MLTLKMNGERAFYIGDTLGQILNLVGVPYQNYELHTRKGKRNRKLPTNVILESVSVNLQKTGQMNSCISITPMHWAGPSPKKRNLFIFLSFIILPCSIYRFDSIL